MALIQQFITQMRANEARSAGYKTTHILHSTFAEMSRNNTVSAGRSELPAAKTNPCIFVANC
jgi:hypothetical protein